jgi:hypothetical protein
MRWRDTPPMIRQFRRRYGWHAASLMVIIMVLIYLYPSRLLWLEVAGLLVFIGMYLGRANFRRRLRGRLRVDGYRMCATCGYSLKGLNEKGRCPECGTVYDMGTLESMWKEYHG